jgi:hypothetical protein
LEKAIHVTRKPHHQCAQLFAGKAHATNLTYTRRASTILRVIV